MIRNAMSHQYSCVVRETSFLKEIMLLSVEDPVDRTKILVELTVVLLNQT